MTHYTADLEASEASVSSSDTDPHTKACHGRGRNWHEPRCPFSQKMKRNRGRSSRGPRGIFRVVVDKGQLVAVREGLRASHGSHCISRKESSVLEKTKLHESQTYRIERRGCCIWFPACVCFPGEFSTRKLSALVCSEP